MAKLSVIPFSIFFKDGGEIWFCLGGKIAKCDLDDFAEVGMQVAINVRDLIAYSIDTLDVVVAQTDTFIFGTH